MTVKHDDSKITLYVSLGIGAVVVVLVMVFGLFLMLGLGVELVPTPADSTGVNLNVPVSVENSGDSNNPPLTCKAFYSEIDQELKEANYCETSSDCAEITLGGTYIEFGCYHHVNKALDQTKIMQKMNQYLEQGCTKMINDCAPAPKATCIQNKCVSKEETLNSPQGSQKVTGVTAFLGAGNGIGEKFTVESNFAPEDYVFKILSQDKTTGMIELEYDKQFLGDACSSEQGKGKLQLPYNFETCLTSTTCDAGETVCFENQQVENGLKLIHTVEQYDGEKI